MPKTPKHPVARLPIRIEPLHDESLDGFLARLAEANRFDLLGPWMSDYLGIELGRGPLSTEGLENAAIGSGIDIERLARMQAHHTALQSNSDRDPVDKQGRTMAYRYRRACPGCLRETRGHKAAFEFRFVRICPEHRTQLLDACPGCGRALGWNMPYMHRCSDACEYDLRQFEQEQVAPEILEGQTYLLNAINGIGQAEPPLLAGLSPPETYYLLRHFGYFAHVSRAGLPGDPFSRHVTAMQLNGPTTLKNEGSADLYHSRFLAAGLRILSESPEVFEVGMSAAVGRAEKRAVYITQTVRLDTLGWSRRPLIADILERAIKHLPKEAAKLLNSHGSQGRLKQRLAKAGELALD